MGWSGRAPALQDVRSCGGLRSTRSTRPMLHKSAPPTVSTIGIDLGKNSFHLVGLDQRGAIVWQLKCSRAQLERRLANIPSCLIGMEACSGAHYIARQLAALGHDVRLMPAQYVKPFLKGHKNDYRDAEAIAEAVQRPTMHFVAIKTPEQMDLLALHRVRSRLVSQRTGVINQIRGFLIERGITVRQGVVPLRKALPDILSLNTGALSPRMVNLIAELVQDWRRLHERIAAVSAEIEALAEQDAACQRVMTVPGVGPIISSAVVAAIGNGAGFTQGRDFGAWLGLVPKQEATGDRTILGKISKRGNKYLRTLFVQAAHVVLARRPNAAMRSLWPWIEQASRRLHRNMLAIALANKLARIAWAVLARGRSYQPRIVAIGHQTRKTETDKLQYQELSRRGLRDGMKRWTNGLPGATKRLGAKMALRGLAASQPRMRADTHDGPEQIAPLERPDTLMQLSRSLISEVHLVPHGPAIRVGTKRTRRGASRRGQVGIRWRNVTGRRSGISMMVVAAAAVTAVPGHAQEGTRGRIAVAVDGVLAAGPCWCVVIPRLEAAGVTA